MKIIYLHQYFKTPEEGGAIRSYYIANALVNEGFEVEMITAHNKGTYQKKIIQGITVHYLPVYYENRLGILGRLWSFWKFSQMGYRLAAQISNPTLCFATSTPLSIGWIAYGLKKKKKIPYIFEVRDLWPQAPIELGYIRNRFAKQFLYHWEKKIYQKAEAIITLSPTAQNIILSKVPNQKVVCIPNMADTDFFKFEATHSAKTDKSKFVISYIGTLGRANAVSSMLDIAHFAQINQLTNIEFWIVGTGVELDILKDKVRDLQLQNVIFYPYTDKGGVHQILLQTAAVYVSFSEESVLETTSPNKFFDALAAGKLCLVNVKGWLKDLVEKNQCGLYIDRHHIPDFFERLSPFVQNKDVLYTFQQNARKLAENEFSRSNLCQQVVRLIQEILYK